MRFYTTDAAKNSITFDGAAFDLSKKQINDIAALLRALNALDNLEQGNRYLDFALEIQSFDEEVALAFLAIAESQTQDTIEVLTDGPLLLFPGVKAGGVSLLTRIRQARDFEQEALRRGVPLSVKLIRRAQAAQDDAIEAILVE